MSNNHLTDAALAELDRLHKTAIPLTFANAAGHIFNAYPALRQRLLAAESRLAEAERERDELRDRCELYRLAASAKEPEPQTYTTGGTWETPDLQAAQRLREGKDV